MYNESYSFWYIFSCKSVELSQLHIETMLCYIGAAVENFSTSKEGEVIGKKSIGTMLAQFGKGKDEQYSYTVRTSNGLSTFKKQFFSL